ncbi:MAG: translation initiation factor IF-2 N-terminal domain-containing protein, partial [Pirellulales bacterium]|nr:translation initiation factor IF-2 N-terminal domain-containing protein [Pirellulales bacterium]
MSVRIYTLAKELNLENKVVVDACSKAGITGKGSALASLTDEQADQVRAVLKSGAAAPAAPAEEPAGAPSAAKASALLRGRRTAKPSARPTTRPQQESDAPLRREDYVAPAAGGKVRTLGESAAKTPAEKKNGDAAKPAAKAGPSIKLAPMPEVEQPAENKSAANEPAPQKPDIRLPADAIRAGRMGSKPLDEELKKHEPKTTSKKKTSSRGGADQPPAPPVEPGSEKPGQRDRRKVNVEEEKEREKRSMLGGREQRQLRRKRRTGRGGDDEPMRRRGPRRIKRTGANTAAPRKGKVTLELPCTVRTFSEAVGVPSMTVLRELIGLGVMANINATLDDEMAELLAEQLGADIEFRHAVNLEDDLLASI